MARDVDSSAICVLPDMGSSLTRTIGAAEQILVNLDPGEVGAGVALPAPLARDVALTAVRRIWSAVATTQGIHAEAAGLTSGQLDHGGRTLAPLRLVRLRGADLTTLLEAGKQLEVLRLAGCDAILDALLEQATAMCGPAGDLAAAADLLAASLGQVHAVLAANRAEHPDPSVRADVVLLGRVIAATHPRAQVVFDGPQVAAAARVRARAWRAWRRYGRIAPPQHAGDPYASSPA
jgi:hypothetical protein